MWYNAMAYIPALNTVKVVLEQLFGSQVLANIIYFLMTGTPTEEIMDDLVLDVIDWWDDNIRTHLSNALSLTAVTGTDLTTESGATVTETLATPLAGAGTEEATPSNAATVVSFRTAGRGRSARGRNYVSGLTTAHTVSPTDISTSQAGALLAGYEALSAVETANSCTHVVVSKFHNKLPRASALIQPVTAYVCDTAIDSQRRRLRGRGV